MKYSQYQKDIFKFCKSGKGNAIVQAVAGSGKTTTAVKAIEYCKGSSIFLAFNKSIASELCERGVNGKTFHGLCYSSILKILKIKTVDGDKLHKIIRNKLTYEQSKMYASLIKKLVSLGKQSGIGIFCGYEEFQRLFLEHDMYLEVLGSTTTELFGFCKMIFDLSVSDKSSVDFDDMLYFTVKEQIQLPVYNNIFVDEAQDTNMIQRAILRQMMTTKSRLIAIGDKYQSIYRFRGADSNAMDLIRDEFKCTELPLSVSYRCAKNIVRHAQRYSPLIEFNPDAPEGSVIDLPEWNVKIFKAKDYVICRTTAPIINVAYSCLKASIPVQVLGRDIGKGLINLVEGCVISERSINTLLINVEKYRANEIEKFTRLGQDSKIESVNDKVDTIVNLCKALPFEKSTVDYLVEVIEKLFEEKRNAVTFSTIHKSKGLEADRIYWLNYDQCPPPWATKKEDYQQELNICYVASTRAKNELILIKLNKG